MDEKAVEQNKPPAKVVNLDPSKPLPENVSIPPAAGRAHNQWQLIVAIAAVVAAVVVIAALVFMVMEYRHYQQSPSIWPPAVQAK